MKILLVGNPNVGKSVIFSRLTGVDVIASNYPGTTVEYTKGYMSIRGKKTTLIDTPGAYSLKPRCRAEEVTLTLIEEAQEGDIIVNVVDSTNLERNLWLTTQLLEKNIPVVVALNMWDDTKHLGIKIDKNKLEELLGVPVTPTVAITGEGIKELVERIPLAKSPKTKKRSDEERWATIGEVIEKVQRVTHRHHTIWEKIEDSTIKPATGLPIAFIVITLTFMLVRLVGESLIEYILNPIFEYYRQHVVLKLSVWLGHGLPHDILVGKLVGGEVEFMESMGLLTTGVYVPFAAVLPYIIAFYFMLSILEDSGYLPRLSTLSDNVFHRLGMHGHGIVPVFLGLGCNVPGALAIRTLETRKQRFISATLLSIAVPCMAQTAMIFGILGSYGAKYIYMVFTTLAIVYAVGGLLLNKFISGRSPEIFLEVPPYRKPSLRVLLKKTWTRVRWFLKDAVPWLFFGVILVNVLYIIGVLELVGWVFSPIVSGVLGLPKEAVAAMLVGFLRKDLAVGMLLPLGMTPEQLVIAATVLTMYFPCAATFVTLLKELGVGDMLKSALIMVATSLVVGGVMRLILLGV